MHSFNAFALAHPHLQPVVLPMRDGLSVVRYDPGGD
jgi:predicted O-methyltransferase YrrM